ncbi:MAG TPA: hypothetical protein VJ783_00600 [Pirellulales bacterium]|nr:hypothetical protein [Pirellulales bacterium]
MLMRRADVIFCERMGAWAAAWRRVWQTPGLRPPRPTLQLVETRSADECREVLSSSPEAFVVVELTAERCDVALDLLLYVGERFSAAAAGVVAEREMAAYEWLARELGALAFVTSPRRLGGLCQLALRQAGRRSPSPASLSERMWTDLPWA